MKPLLRVRLGDALLDDGDDDVVGTKRAARHDVRDLTAQRGSGFDGGAQHVAGGKLDNSVFGDEVLGLSALARPRRAQQDQSHLRRPLSFDLFIRPSYWCASR